MQTRGRFQTRKCCIIEWVLCTAVLVTGMFKQRHKNENNINKKLVKQRRKYSSDLACIFSLLLIDWGFCDRVFAFLGCGPCVFNSIFA